MEKKFCVNCKHMMAFAVFGPKDTPIPEPVCRHPKSRKTNQPNLVTGVVPEDYRTCNEQRAANKQDPRFCTKDAAWFEPKPEPLPMPEPRRMKFDWWEYFGRSDPD